MFRSGLFCLAILLAGCADLPRDPENTFNRVRQYHEVRVGLCEHPPWVVRTAGEPTGAEVQLIREFALSIGATPKWFWGTEQEHFEALAKFELDIAIGGFESKTPWKKQVGFTRPYFEERIVVGVPKTANAPASLKGQSVAVEPADATAALLRKKDANPVRMADVTSASGPAAAPDWLLEKTGFTLTGFELARKKHIIATPPGENGWIMRLETYLQDQRPRIKTLLQEAATP